MFLQSVFARRCEGFGHAGRPILGSAVLGWSRAVRRETLMCTEMEAASFLLSSPL